MTTFEERRRRVAAIRDGIRRRLDDGDDGLSISRTLGRQFGQFITDVAEEELDARFKTAVAIVGVGGTGRGTVSPHSDVDLMILVDRSELEEFENAVVPFVQAFWDSGLKLGHSVRTVRQAVQLAKEDDKTATSFLRTELLWGSTELAARFNAEFRRKVVDRNRTSFTERCVAARRSEFTEEHPAIQLLEPNVKTSLGGLRDVQLLMWIAEAHYGVSDFITLQLYGNVLSQIDARRISDAYSFLLGIRGQLHSWADGPQDKLTRQAQLAIAERSDVQPTETRRSVELLMQQYFRHTGAVAAITKRFVDRHRPRNFFRMVKEIVRERRIDGRLIVGPLRVDASPKSHDKLVESVESILRVYEVAAEAKVLPSPTLSEAIRVGCVVLMNQRPRLVDEADTDLVLSDLAADRLKSILRCGSAVAPTLRHMADTGAIDLVLPEWGHIRGLLQFNQYHHYTVDEHTLRATEFLTKLETEQSDAGAAYRNIRNKAVVHLGIVLHDIGKGYDEDHCLVGERIAAIVGPRLKFSPAACDQLGELVRWHLELPDLALRRDLTDEKLIISLAHKVGTSDTLTMLYTLVVADIRGVGPGTWTKWKGELLHDLYRRTAAIVAGSSYDSYESSLINRVIEATASQPVPLSGFGSPEAWASYVREQLVAFSPYYLTTTPPEMIAADLARLRELTPNEIEVIASVDDATKSYDFRVLLHGSTARDCFHRICGVLTARSLTIVDAEINTTTDGYVVDGFRTVAKVPITVPIDRFLDDVCAEIRRVLLDDEDITDIFHKHERYGVEEEDASLPSGLADRVVLDAESSETHLIIDVFSQNRRGLLYTLAKTLRELNLDVELAKIGTHFDQVIDVFYVTEADGTKPAGSERLSEIRTTVMDELRTFQEDGFRSFRRSSTSIFKSV